MPNRNEDFSLKETSPNIASGRFSRDRVTTAFDLVEQMQYLYVRVVKARELPPMDGGSGCCDPYVEVKLGNYRGMTKQIENLLNPQWNQVFAFSKDRIQTSVLEVNAWDRAAFVGRVLFELIEVPKRVPPDSPLAPEWQRLENVRGEKVRGELMLSVWMGTQADEAFPEAWHLDATTVSGDGIANIRSKVYLSPKLWYLRVNVIEVQDLQPTDRNRSPEVFVKVVFGNMGLRTKNCQNKNVNPMWNEDLMFVAAEPFEQVLVVSVENKVAPNKDEVLGRCVIPVQTVEKRFDYKPVNSRWHNLEHHVVGENGERREIKLASKLHLRVCLDGGYHVFDESTHHSSDFRASMKRLWRPSIGVLELGILSAQGLLPMKMKDGRPATDAYCVAKYGPKWIRTRTIIDSFNPKWNEQYTWEVFDPCTVITIGVFDNCHLQGVDIMGNGAKDARIGKVRIRLSTLETDRVYTHSYPLIVLHPSGVKKIGEIQLAVRFCCASLLNMLHMYSQPIWPKMHYLHPLSIRQINDLRYQATQIVSVRLSRAEPPLRKEAVEFMLDVGSHLWSVRRSKANVYRISGVLSGLTAVCRWFDYICSWKNPFTTVLVHIMFLILVIYPQLILSTVFLYLLLIGIWNYRWRPRHPPHMDTKLSYAEAALADELDEEFDTFPTSRQATVIRMRYDRLRNIASQIQTVLGDLATQCEKFHSLISWRDPRATMLFLTFCLVAAVVLFVIPFQVLILLAGFYVLRHPRFRYKLPSVPINFFRRLPARTDSLL
ncbi:FT-interacting protein 4-like [Cornus florida]|uniref:FT-interacting protein 4-like n=1 Tax=Cornus florida TaxID=4283 RepID=UPI00289E8250|nr:FT-interacting protein 4-like [Cornus florida]